MKELTAREFIEIFQDICVQRKECKGCDLADNLNHKCYLLGDRNKKEEILEIIKEHSYTLKDDLLKKYPNTKLTSSGNPNFCVINLGIDIDCDDDKLCSDCWNERVPKNEELL